MRRAPACGGGELEQSETIVDMRVREALPAPPACAHLMPLTQLGSDTLLGKPAHTTERLRAVAVVEVARPEKGATEKGARLN